MGIASEIPQHAIPIEINALPLRAYCKIYNDWWKSEAVEKDLYCPTDNTTIGFVSKTQSSYWDKTSPTYPERCIRGGVPAKVNREFDYFSACLPEPQRGPSVLVPLVGEAPVIYGKTKIIPSGEGAEQNWYKKEAYAGFDTTVSGGETPFAYPTGSSVSDTFEAASIEYTQLMVDLENAVGASVNAIRTSFAIQVLRKVC